MSELEAGQKLDALIAEKIMGYRVTRFTPANYPVEVTVFWRGDEPMYTCDERSCNFMMFRNGVDQSAGIVPTLPGYSTEIERAWEVVEKLATQADPWMLTLKNWNYYGDRSCTAEFVSHPLGPPSVEIRAGTAPLAICLAALEAVHEWPAPHQTREET